MQAFDQVRRSRHIFSPVEICASNPVLKWMVATITSMSLIREWVSMWTPTSQSSQDVTKRGRKEWKSQGWGTSYEKLSSVHGYHTHNSQQPWRPAQDQPSKTSQYSNTPLIGLSRLSIEMLLMERVHRGQVTWYRWPGEWKGGVGGRCDGDMLSVGT